MLTEEKQANKFWFNLFVFVPADFKINKLEQISSM